MRRPNPNFASSLLEQAHLTYTRKRFAEARLVLGTLVIAHPDDREAADLYVRVVLAQAAATGCGPLPWNRDAISKSAGQAIISGLVLFAFGIITAIPAVRAGFAQGSGPHTAVIVDGNKHVFSVPLYDVLFQSSLFILAGVTLLAYSWWDIFKKNTVRND